MYGQGRPSLFTHTSANAADRPPIDRSGCYCNTLKLRALSLPIGRSGPVSGSYSSRILRMAPINQRQSKLPNLEQQRLFAITAGLN
eukprot:jgi/Botrbrau1/3809/Bobra.0183s0041.1